MQAGQTVFDFNCLHLRREYILFADITATSYTQIRKTIRPANPECPSDGLPGSVDGCSNTSLLTL